MEQQTLVISNALFTRLRMDAETRGMSIEDLVERALEIFERQDSELHHRAETGRRVNAIFAEMSAKYGETPDSAELVREDRNR